MKPWNLKCMIVQIKKMSSTEKTRQGFSSKVGSYTKANMKPFPAVYYYRRQEDRQRFRPQIENLLAKSAGIFQGKVIIALGEAVSNALRHGTVVRIRLNKIGENLILRVKDDGPGFAGNHMIEILREEQGTIFERFLYEESGRGLAIITAWMDLVRYNRQGNELLMVKKCQQESNP
ncbi:MAG: ATP-binding protein [Sporomusaceae bacterium]|nr:ATP-binding protein [Sporomusaceae bacterium]